MASIQAVTRVGTNHVPLLISSGEHEVRPLARFHFETYWFNHDEFPEAVKEKWKTLTSPHRTMSILDTWHHCTNLDNSCENGGLILVVIFGNARPSFCAPFKPLMPTPIAWD